MPFIAPQERLVLRPAAFFLAVILTACSTALDLSGCGSPILENSGTAEIQALGAAAAGRGRTRSQSESR